MALSQRVVPLLSPRCECVGAPGKGEGGGGLLPGKRARETRAGRLPRPDSAARLLGQEGGRGPPRIPLQPALPRWLGDPVGRRRRQGRRVADRQLSFPGTCVTHRGGPVWHNHKSVGGRTRLVSHSVHMDLGSKVDEDIPL